MSDNETENAPEHNSVTNDHRNGTPTLSSSSQGEVLYFCICSADFPDHTCREKLDQTLVRLVSLAPGAPTPIPDVPRTSNSEMNMHHMCVNWRTPVGDTIVPQRLVFRMELSIPLTTKPAPPPYKETLPNRMTPYPG